MKKYEKEVRTFSEWNLEVVPRVPIYILCVIARPREHRSLR